MSRPATVLTLVAAALLAGAAEAGAQAALVSKVGLPVTNPTELVRLPASTSMFCLRPTTAAEGARVVLGACRALDAGSVQAFKLWQFSANGTGPVRHVPSGLCLDARQDDQSLILYRCHGGRNQQFTNTGADEFRLSDGRCVTVGYGQPRAGTAMTIAACRSDANQAFYRTN